MSIIQVENVTFEYQQADQAPLKALQGVSLQVEEGEFVSIIGHNGSGKSTLAKLLNGLVLPTSGRVTVDGLDTADEANRWEIRQRAGMVFQNPDNQMVAAVVEEDVAFGPENLGVESSLIRKRVDESLACVNMTEYASFEPHKLSGGQKQRVAIAGIIAMRPKILILDEPTAMLDPSGRRDVMDTVLRLNREEHMTVVLITHFMEEAMQADRIIVLNEGETVTQGTPREVFGQIEALKKIGLDIPAAVELARLLRLKGLPIPEGVMDTERLVDEICRLL